MCDNNIKGKITELRCQQDFIERGILVSQPIVADSKYDFIVDIKGKLFKVQCKSSCLSKTEDYITMRTKSKNIRTNKESYYSKQDIDYFYTCFNNISYLVPVELAIHGETRLRFESTQPNNPNIRWAKDFEFSSMLQKIMEEVSN